ncbi:hypothetical protein [Streptomyces sp. NBC_00470]|uniref:hypothetical protein n=1 Tax=Streptomyces sp. NBC_00470 TaxID=2975753 RepID=UPI0032450E71
MGEITGKEPGHWHDELGRHRMNDARSYYGPQPVIGPDGEPLIEKGEPVMSDGLHRKYWEADERMYADHLATHEQMRDGTFAPEPADGDSDVIKTLFAERENAEQIITNTNQLITALREKAALGE